MTHAIDGTAVADDVSKTIDALLLPKTTRHRSEAHRRWVASLLCVVCSGGKPPPRSFMPCEAISQCAHLAFAQPRARGLKATDAAVLPMCPRHHSEFDQAGDGRAWWAARGIDALATAESLWRASIAAGRVRPEGRAA